MPRTILHIDLDAFFVSVEQVINPALRRKAVIVGGLGGRGVVASASYEARKFKVRAGMPVVTARLLCPHAIFLGGNFPLYRSYSDRFMDILARFTPLLEPGGLDEAYLDLTGSRLLYGSPVDAASNIRSIVRNELGLPASAGISTCKVVAKIASDMAKPDGLLEVPPGRERDFLSPLRVEKMPGIGAKTGRRLKELGIHTLGQVTEMSPVFLKDVFGVCGDTMMLFAMGRDDRPIEPTGEARYISREVTFSSDTSRLSYLKGVLASLSEGVGREMRRQDKRAKTITLKVRHDDFETFTRSNTLRLAVDSDQEIYLIAWQLLEKVIGRRTKPFRLLGISASNLVCGEEQLSFFSYHNEQQRSFNRVVDKVRLKYGIDSLQWGRTFKT